MTDYVFAPIGYPGATTTGVLGINSSSEIVGDYRADGVTHAFFDTAGSYTSLDYPNARATYASAVNGTGDIVGFYVDAAGKSHGFSDIGNTLTPIDIAGASSTALTASTTRERLLDTIREAITMCMGSQILMELY